MTAVLLSEWTKLRTIRSTVWTLALTFLISVGLAAASGFSVRNAYESGNAAMVRPDFDPVYSGFVGLLYGQLALIAFGALLVTSEYGTGTMRATLAAVPQRGRAYAGKLLVGCAAALVVAVATALVSWPVNQAGLGPYGTSMAAPGVPRALAGAAVYLTLICAFSAGVAAILRSSALTLGILIPLFFIVGPILSRIPGVSAVARYLPDQAGQRMMDTTNPLPDALVLTAWTAAAAGAGYALVRHRDA
ncbi:ABC transporter permease subunit [Dactylosporangium sucinum]|uniref:ABC transporter n=1 Tax=Dactylosporangium sucinum TaxID=1424081 RepID=A0A917TZI2_9ACTN|nr:ABC transporter permease subunit [Dactylosporangium sucinum]GGM47230.1 ABC transporter [Dactylosporangium sucinum]